MKVLLSRDFLIGAICGGLSLVVLKAAQAYSFGTLARIGPGLVPFGLSLLLLLVSAALIIQGIRFPDAVEPTPIRPFLCIVAGMVAFGLLIDRLGFLIAGTTLLLAGAVASRESRWAEVAMVSAAVLPVSYCVFALALGVPIRLLPPNP